MNLLIIEVLSKMKISYKHKINYFYVNYSKIVLNFLYSLKKQGYILDYIYLSDIKKIKIFLDIYNSNSNFFSKIRILSSPSKPLFVHFFYLKKKYKPFDFFVIREKNFFYISEEVFVLKKSGELICDTLNF